MVIIFVFISAAVGTYFGGLFLSPDDSEKDDVIESESKEPKSDSQRSNIQIGNTDDEIGGGAAVENGTETGDNMVDCPDCDGTGKIEE